MATMFKGDPLVLRKALLGINGIGPETADSILLYAGGLPYLVVDTYTRRVFFRHGLVESGVEYHQLQSVLTESLPKDPTL